MYPNINKIASWYGTALGNQVQRLLMKQLEQFVPKQTDARVLIVGYAPAAGDVFPQALWAAPEQMGILPWPENAPNRATLVKEHQLPFADDEFDKVILLHVLEYADAVPQLLEEVYRITAPGGKVLAVDFL